MLPEAGVSVAHDPSLNGQALHSAGEIDHSSKQLVHSSVCEYVLVSVSKDALNMSVSSLSKFSISHRVKANIVTLVDKF